MEYLNIVLKFLGNVAVATFYQILAIFGFIFIFGILLYFVSRSTRRVFVNSYNGKLDIYLTGWIGTPVHEIGHAVFCLLFGHRINEIKLFAPNSNDGSLGYVNHSYNSESLYQNIGNFFIGSGPIIFGSLLLYALMYWLLPNFKEISSIVSSSELRDVNFFGLIHNIGSTLLVGLKLIGQIFSFSNLGSLLFFIFLYVSLCISSHMQLSPPDITGMLSGLGTIIAIFLIINFITLLFGFNITNYILYLSRFTSVLLGVFMFSLFISLINFFITYIVISIIHYIKYKRLVSIL
jgi:hypothetical protein